MTIMMITDTRIRKVLSTCLNDKFIPPTSEFINFGVYDGSMSEYIVMRSEDLPDNILDKSFDSCSICGTDYVIYENNIINRNLLFYYR